MLVLSVNLRDTTQLEAELLVFAVSMAAKWRPWDDSLVLFTPHPGALSTVLESFLPDYALYAPVYV